jgi:hypothetical protein
MKIDIYKGFRKGEFATIDGELVKISHFVINFDSIKQEYATVHFRYIKDTSRYLFNTDFGFLRPLKQSTATVLYG